MDYQAAWEALKEELQNRIHQMAPVNQFAYNRVLEIMASIEENSKED
jgi:hypothetical protein